MENNLRKEAESLLEKKFNNEELQKKSLEEIVHELKVHQIELELQNEELIKTQENLLSSQQKYFELFDLAPVAYLIVDNSTNIKDANLTASNLLSCERSLMITKRFESFIHPDYQDPFYFFFNGLKKNALETIHESCLKINHRDVFVRIACNIEKSHNIPQDQLIRFALIDITTEKMAELQHLESEKRFRQFAALLPQVVCELDGQFNVLYINDFGKSLFGLKDSGSYNLFEFLDESNKLRVQESFNDLVNKTSTKDPGLQITFKNVNGNDVTLFTYASFEIEKDEIKTIRAIGIDLYERLKLEKNLNTLNEELNIQKTQLENFNKILEDRVAEEVENNRIKDHLMSLQARQAAMGEMVGHIAHQWKQPLNTLNLIVLDIQDAYKYGELNEEYINKSVHTAKKVIDHMSHTIDDFRNFFKPLKSKTSFNVKQQIDTALSFIRATIEVAGIRLENNIKDDFFTRGFPNEFSQVVINIVNNAREAILENGHSKDSLIRIDGRKDDQNGFVYFYNNGGAIPDDVVPHIFEPYFTTKDNNQGTGIGLYLAKTIIKQNMNGEINLKNKGHGVEFEIVLPLS